MLRNLSKYYLFICCKQSSSTHFCHYLATAFVTDVLAGSNPSAMGTNKNGPLARTVSNSVVGDEGCRVRLTPPAFASSLRSSRAALENASRFLSSAPLRVRIPSLAHKKAPRADESPGRSVTLAGTEGFEPPTAGTKNRSSTVELRPSMGVAKSNSSSLPNLRGHRKRHRVGVPRASGRR